MWKIINACLKFPTSVQPCIANFGKFKLNSRNLAGIILHSSVYTENGGKVSVDLAHHIVLASYLQFSLIWSRGFIMSIPDCILIPVVALGGFHIWRPAKFSDFLPIDNCHKSADFFLLSAFWRLPHPPGHCGRHIWKPPYDLDGTIGSQTVRQGPEEEKKGWALRRARLSAMTCYPPHYFSV